MLPSVKMIGGEGVRTIDFWPNDIQTVDFWPNDVASLTRFDFFQDKTSRSSCWRLSRPRTRTCRPSCRIRSTRFVFGPSTSLTKVHFHWQSVIEENGRMKSVMTFSIVILIHIITFSIRWNKMRHSAWWQVVVPTVRYAEAQKEVL